MNKINKLALTIIAASLMTFSASSMASMTYDKQTNKTVIKINGGTTTVEGKWKKIGIRTYKLINGRGDCVMTINNQGFGGSMRCGG